MTEKTNEFINYTNNYDKQIPAISRKFFHTFRVVEYAERIAKSINLSEEKIELVKTAALLHDIGRFEQWNRYGTYKDKVSIDHADLGVEILLGDNYIECYEKDKRKQEIILKAVKNHNKLSVEKGLDEEEVLIANIIRDADKIDILKEQGTEIDEKTVIDDRIFDCLNNKSLVLNELVKTKTDIILRAISFIYDMNFECSKLILTKEKIFEEKLNLLKKFYPDDERINKLIKDVEKVR